MIKLVQPDIHQINKILEIYNSSEGNKMNEALSNLFLFLNKNAKEEILIKAVSINQIYSTSILNIFPVVEKIFDATKDNQILSIGDYVELIDKIAKVSWIDKKEKLQQRSNLSFASKYVHFLSNKVVPIYDSYVWILLTGYLNQNRLTKIRASQPNNYKEFYNIYSDFLNLFSLNSFDIYRIDKYLWQYCKILLLQVSQENKLNSDQSKALLKKLIKNGESTADNMVYTQSRKKI